MKLISLQVENYKVIDDTGAVKVDPKVTALVGKNESGKTAILKSLWKTRNVADANFDKLLDYPRNRYNKERAGTQEITVLEHELSSDEQASFLAAAPTNSAAPTKIILNTWYEGRDVEHGIDFDPPLEFPKGQQATAALQALSGAIAPNEEDETTSALHKSIAKSLEQAKADEWLWSAANIAALPRLPVVLLLLSGFLGRE